MPLADNKSGWARGTSSSDYGSARGQGTWQGAEDSSAMPGRRPGDARLFTRWGPITVGFRDNAVKYGPRAVNWQTIGIAQSYLLTPPGDSARTPDQERRWEDRVPIAYSPAGARQGRYAV